MTGLKTWLMGLMTVSMALSVLQAMTPKGKYRTVLRFSGGLVLLLVTVQPLLQADWSVLWQSAADWGEEIAAQSAEAEMNQQEELSRLIAERTGAYIQEKAALQGVSCQVCVSCEERDGVPIPAEVWLETAYNRELSDLIARDLAIPAEQQHWQKE